MHPVLFTIGNFSFRFYGLMIAIGTLVGYWFVTTKKKDIALTEDDLLDLLIWLIIMGIIGAKILFILTHSPLYYLQNPKEMLSGSGLSFIGIVIFGLGTTWVYAKKKKVNFFALLDTISPAVMIGYAIGRIGCFLNGCCFGLPTDSWVGFRFVTVDPYPRYPTQLFISVGALIAFFILKWIYKNKKSHGKVFGWFLILYSIITFIVGFYRDMPRYYGLQLTLNQYSTFIIVPIAICILIFTSKHQQIIQQDGKTLEGSVETWNKSEYNQDDNEVIIQ
jgi:phosphatidylglycerol:prolipoprotein diacylglycerol transferase